MWRERKKEEKNDAIAISYFYHTARYTEIIDYYNMRESARVLSDGKSALEKKEKKQASMTL